MLRINLMKNCKYIPAVIYKHYLFNEAVKVYRYPKLTTKNIKIARIIGKVMAIFHDYLVIGNGNYNIYFGIVHKT